MTHAYSWMALRALSFSFSHLDFSFHKTRPPTTLCIYTPVCYHDVNIPLSGSHRWHNHPGPPVPRGRTLWRWQHPQKAGGFSGALRSAAWTHDHAQAEAVGLPEATAALQRCGGRGDLDPGERAYCCFYQQRWDPILSKKSFTFIHGYALIRWDYLFVPPYWFLFGIFEGKDLIGVQNLLKKHQALQAEIVGHEPRIKAVTQKGEAMVEEGIHLFCFSIFCLIPSLSLKLIVNWCNDQAI